MSEKEGSIASLFINKKSNVVEEDVAAAFALALSKPAVSYTNKYETKKRIREDTEGDEMEEEENLDSESDEGEEERREAEQSEEEEEEEEETENNKKKERKEKLAKKETKKEKEEKKEISSLDSKRKKKAVDDEESEDEKANVKSKHEEEADRTVFIGNVPHTIGNKATNPLKLVRSSLLKIFSKIGKVESIRFRSAGYSNPKLKKSNNAKIQEFHESRPNLNAYLVFEDSDSVKKAIKLDGMDFHNNTLRIDSVTKKVKKMIILICK